MAYPTVQGPYGLKPINLIGGQFYAGNVRQLQISYGYATSIFYGDVVALAKGLVIRSALTTDGTTSENIGVFLGCSFTNPVTKQKTFSQYYPANTLAGDIFAVVADDPDLVFKAVVCSATTVVGSGSQALIGQNMSIIDNAGNAITGDSRIALTAIVAGVPATTAALPMRVLDVVRETAISVAVPYTSISTVTLTVPALTQPLVAGSSVEVVTANGQVSQTGAFIVANYAIGATSVVTNYDASGAGVGQIANSAGTLIITQYPELLVKINFGSHRYNVALAIAA
jgi:hypothetical protein